MKKIVIGIVGIIPLIMLITACASSTPVSKLTLDQAIERCATEDSSRSIEGYISSGTKIAILGCYSRSDKLSLYVLDEVTSILKESGKLVLADRAEMDQILSEFGVSYNYNYRTGEGQRAVRAAGERLRVRFVVSGYVDYSKDSGDGISFSIFDVQKNDSVATAGWFGFANDEFFRSLLDNDSKTLDKAIEKCAAQVDRKLAGSKIALLSFNSPTEKLSLYILDKMTATLEENGNLTLVDRAQIDLIHSEFRTSYYTESNSTNLRRARQAIAERQGVRFIVSGYQARDNSKKEDGVRFYMWDMQLNRKEDLTDFCDFFKDEHYKSLLKN
jgi:TolB-like protein